MVFDRWGHGYHTVPGTAGDRVGHEMTDQLRTPVCVARHSPFPRWRHVRDAMSFPPRDRARRGVCPSWLSLWLWLDKDDGHALSAWQRSSRRRRRSTLPRMSRPASRPGAGLDLRSGGKLRAQDARERLPRYLKYAGTACAARYPRCERRRVQPAVPYRTLRMGWWRACSRQS